jgi:Cu(I)/Ag(I) efflux system membrane protein CusA/SilA
MIETVVQLHPIEEWPLIDHPRFYSGWAPDWLASVLRPIWPDRRRETWDELIAKLNTTLQLPGWTNAWTMPIRARVDMLTTGVRTPVGIKIFGASLEEIERAGQAVEAVIGKVAGTRSVLYERSLGGTYVDIVPNREALSRFGMQVEDLHSVIELAVGGEPLTVTVEGRSRFTVNVRYKEDFRSTPELLREVLVPLPGSMAEDGVRHVPLGEIASVKTSEGPPMVRNEGGQLVGYVYIDIVPTRDLAGYVVDAQRAVADAQANGEIALGPGMYLGWTGQYELLQDMRERMRYLVPLALFIVALLLYFQFKSLTEVLIVFLSIPFALVGSFWMLYLLDYRLSTAVWVGIIALVGLAAQTGVVMIVYIDHAFNRRLRAGKIRSLDDIIRAHSEGTVQRVRPKLMTVGTMLVGLMPLLWATGSGADVMKRIAAPLLGGLLSSAFLTLELIPVIYTYWRYAQLKRAERTGRPLAEICGIDVPSDKSPAPASS